MFYSMLYFLVQLFYDFRFVFAVILIIGALNLFFIFLHHILEVSSNV